MSPLYSGGSLTSYRYSLFNIVPGIELNGYHSLMI